jgi:hypothetical protein
MLIPRLIARLIAYLPAEHRCMAHVDPMQTQLPIFGRAPADQHAIGSDAQRVAQPSGYGSRPKIPIRICALARCSTGSKCRAKERSQ